MAERSLLEVKNLKTYFNTPEGVVRAVDGVSFSLDTGKTLAIIGESGSGKTITSLTMTRLLPKNAVVSAETIRLGDKDVLALGKNDVRKIRGSEISMIFQEPMTALNPVYKIDRQLGEVFKLHNPKMTKPEIHQASVDILTKVGVPNPEERLNTYAYQLSGGLRQRVMIAIALASQPKIVIADEPTTALDVTIQAQIIELLKELQKDLKMAIILITHDFGIVSQMADDVAVMYAGQIVESGPMSEVFERPLHPYTEGLINSIPGLKIKKGGRLECIPGSVPNPLRMPSGCRFAPRCPYATEACKRQAVEEIRAGSGNRTVRCIRWEE